MYDCISTVQISLSFGFPLLFRGKPLLRCARLTKPKFPPTGSSPPVLVTTGDRSRLAGARSPRRVAGQPAPAAETKENKPAKRLSPRGLASRYLPLALCSTTLPLGHSSSPSHRPLPGQNPPPPRQQARRSVPRPPAEPPFAGEGARRPHRVRLAPVSCYPWTLHPLRPSRSLSRRGVAAVLGVLPLPSSDFRGI